MINATTSDPSTWRPAGESATNLSNDAIKLVATILCGFGYGIAFTLYSICAQKLYVLAGDSHKKNQARFILVYITIMILCGGLYFASASRVLQLGYVNFRKHPLGPHAYTLVIFSTPINIMGFVTYFIVNWMMNAMLIWRIFVLYKQKGHPWAVIAVPCLLYLTSVAMSVVLIVQICRPSPSFWSSAAVRFSMCYYALTSSLSIIATILTTFRLVMARKHNAQAIGNASHIKEYLSITTVLIESSALYAIWSVIFIGLYAFDHPMQNMFLVTLTSISIVTLLLIVYRVSEGRAWRADTEAVLTAGRRTASTVGGGQGSNKYIRPSFGSGSPSGSATRFEDAMTVDTFTIDDSKKRMTMDS